ncbi:MAG: ligase-associated DNA damage response endonuclease PdeM [Planctomycetota bacterium]|nr:MAG: ligase-associated DNA damage response endonuclease PdeM [Planctomycetota bacterium]
MIDGAIEIGWHGVRLVMLPDRCVWLPDAGSVLVADMHLGKPASFRAMGVPVPEAVTGRDLHRISALLGITGAKRLIVLGDLIHDAAALQQRTLDAVRAWRGSLGSIEINLVVGNHDRRARTCEPLGVRALGDRAVVGGVVLTHEPPRIDQEPTLCGHIHPVVSVGDGPRRVRSACFWFGGMTGILPAFGSFTGGQLVACEGAAVFAAGERSVVPVTRAAGALCVGDSDGIAAETAYDRL